MLLYMEILMRGYRFRSAWEISIRRKQKQVVDVPASEGDLLPTFLMAPRSRSSSESSHDSESPRKRAPSCSDAEGEIDVPGSPAINGSYSANELPRVTPGCIHIAVLLGSTKLVHNYEKAVRWAARSRNSSGPPRKRRKARLTHSSP